MNEKEIIYSDGHGVEITPEYFTISNNNYKVAGITDVNMIHIKPERSGAIFTIILGLLLIIAGVLQYPVQLADYSYNFGNIILNTNAFAVIVGCILLIAGITMAVIVRDKYTVRIETAEGKKDAVVSRDSNYILQIVNALKSAFAFHNNDVNYNQTNI